MSKQIVIDPITRIEGHLRIECAVENGQVQDARSIGTMWRGIETILKGKDPREAWLIVQRICGVCTTVHAMASVRAVENALDLEIPLNAQYIRNMIVGAHCLADNIIHFYILSAVDWVDIASAALKADPRSAAALAQKLSPWKDNSAQEFKETQDKLKKLIESGQLGPFASGYWGHPAMQLDPDVNLIAAVHYFQALEYQRKINKVVTILGSKTPHIQNLAVGGVANPINLDSPATLTMERLYYIKTLIDEIQDFVQQVYLVDVATIGAMYPEWCSYGKGNGNYLSVPEMPTDGKGMRFAMPGGYIKGGDLSSFRPISTSQDPYFSDNVKESVKHSYYAGDWTRHPYVEETEPQFNDKGGDKYSWVKSPSFLNEPAEVGPVASVLAMNAARHAPTIRHSRWMLEKMAAISGNRQELDILPSTMGRHIARSIRAAVVQESLAEQWQGLITNISSGDYTTFNPPHFPEGEQRGVGIHEAPRGTLSHWIVIENGKIRNYQAVVPSTWLACPRGTNDEPGYYERCLVGNPVADPEKPLEILRTIHSFDPCMACAVHLLTPEGGPLSTIKVM
ncbi:nickel-dependent hydrogenase large subunit [Desulfogranum mediterraneum]|uniref:nickel-dependent hydrogenase large subunit n=1 Tax=Desulfogranum mediterraneum TaxID=160661 RepID=UPI000407E72E|nr:nickel-dependent hydrogenase large subunit [Desulfogranum mediterraneum]